jgi:putative oxygen-independent coproporphyrinogen III oxidase
LREIPIDVAPAAARPAESDGTRLQRYLRPGVLTLASLPPMSLYVHLPWCLKKCPYCDFNSHERRDAGAAVIPAKVPPRARHGAGIQDSELRVDPGVRRDDIQGLPEQRYLDALRADLDAALPFVWGRRVQSVFIGGGTPSLFAPESINRMLSDIRARLPLEPGAEITLEANPGTFERERFRAYRAAGVTRLSIGVQSFNDAKLEQIGRVHDATQARAAVTEAADAFDTYNIDLMYALPGQTLPELAADLDEALGFAPPHLSIYHLTIEPNTVFAKFPPALPDHDVACDMLDLLTQRCAGNQLQRYEVSAFARAGQRCVHNLNYWQFGDYLGIGAGAHSKLTYPHRVVRQVRQREPESYMERALRGQCIASDEEVARSQLPFEFMLGALRLREGFELARFCARTGLPLSAIGSALDAAQARGWITQDLKRVQPTALGFDFLNDLQSLFLVDDSS